MRKRTEPVANEKAKIYDEWILTLSPFERANAQIAVANAAKLNHIGEALAKELVITTILFCASLK